MQRWRRAFEVMGGGTAPSAEPWYRRPEAWLVVGVAVLPFGWVLALGRAAWALAMARRDEHR